MKWIFPSQTNAALAINEISAVSHSVISRYLDEVEIMDSVDDSVLRIIDEFGGQPAEDDDASGEADD